MQRMAIREMRNQLGKLAALIDKERELIITRQLCQIMRRSPGLMKHSG